MKQSQFLKTSQNRNAVSGRGATSLGFSDSHNNTHSRVRHGWLGKAALLLFVATLGTAYGDDGSEYGIAAQPADSASPDVKPKTPPPPKFRLFSGDGIDNPGGLAVDGLGNFGSQVTAATA